jgi:hypothetical protein
MADFDIYTFKADSFDMIHSEDIVISSIINSVSDNTGIILLFQYMALNDKRTDVEAKEYFNSLFNQALSLSKYQYSSLEITLYQKYINLLAISMNFIKTISQTYSEDELNELDSIVHAEYSEDFLKYLQYKILTFMIWYYSARMEENDTYATKTREYVNKAKADESEYLRIADTIFNK